jgi:hypothetical protein
LHAHMNNKRKKNLEMKVENISIYILD